MGISKALLLLIFALFVALSHAYTFYVGGREGWVLHPSESYSDWASRNRFQVNDTLIFKYQKGEDSVLEVSQQDYEQCNLSNPIQKMDTGESVFKFDRSGPFYFVSGTDDRCKQGQKLIIVVLAVRPKSTPVEPKPPIISPLAPPIPAPPMAPTLSPGPSSPVVEPPATSPASPMPSPISSPFTSPAPAPTVISSPPAVSPAPAPAPTVISSPPNNSPVSPPAVSPAPAPITGSPPVPSPSFTPPTVTPASSPLTQPSTPEAPITPSVETPNHPTGSSAPVLSDFRVSSVPLTVAVVMLSCGFFN